MENNLTSIVSLIKNGEKPVKDFKLGVEFEHIIVDNNTMESVTYYGEDGVEGILKDLLLVDGYRPTYEGDYLVGLAAENWEVTLEPGGQFEVGLRPCKTIKEVESVYFKVLEDVIPILDRRNLLLLGIGYHPKTSISDIPFNPKKRYEYMSNYLKNTGSYAHNMMKGTAALQVSIDYRDEDDFIRKFKVANFLSPLLYLISDNSPVFEGEVYDKSGIRSLIWENTDKQRSGIVPNSLNKDFGYKDYADYILNIPPILIKKDGDFISTGNKLVKDLMEEYVFTKEELEHIMTMVFPDVRVKNFMEIRVGDSMPYPYNLAYVTLIKGIFYSEIALEYLYNFAQRGEDEQINKVKACIREKGFEAYFGPKTVYEYIRIIFDLAKKSLNEEEKEMLEPLEQLIIDKKNLSILSKEKIEKEGIEGLKWYNFNQWAKGGEDLENN